jgi:hypothetical protein
MVFLAFGFLSLACGRTDAPPAALLPTATPADRFWHVVETARADSSGCEAVARAVAGTLATLPPTAIQEFSDELSRRMVESYRWDLWAVAYVSNDGASDDGFDYFRGWLITRGRRRFERALRDAPAAVEGASPFGIRECEDVLLAPGEAYVRATGRELPPSTVEWPKTPAGRPWSEETIDQVYPGLSARSARW